MARRSRRFGLMRPPKIRSVIIAVVLAALLFGLFNRISGFLKGSAYFTIKKAQLVIIGRASLTDETAAALLNIYRGRNIFGVDLKAAQVYVLARYPEVRAIVISRLLPDTLLLRVKPRRPVAQLAVSSGFCLIDAEGVVLPQIRLLAFEGLPIISVADSALVLRSMGKKCASMGLKRASRLMEVMNQMGFSQGHEIHMIDASDEGNLSLYIEGGIEVKIGSENFKERLTTLNKTFEAGRLDKSQIKYIDLRFGNVIIGPK